MNNISEENFQMAVKYSPIALGLCLLINIWAVMRYREVYRYAIKSEVLLQQLSNAEQVAQGVLQDFSAHANSDPHIAEIFRQATAQVEAAVAAQRNQATPSP